MSGREGTGEMVYFDNAATTFPKPETVIDAVVRYMTRIGGNPGRSGHTGSTDAGGEVFSAREATARLFGVENPMRVIFCMNATGALNLAIQGLLRPGDHVVTTSMEHNSTIRPLKELEKIGLIRLDLVNCPGGRIDLDHLRRSMRPDTKLAVINHASNAFGTIQPLGEIGGICAAKGVVMLADCAQTAGIVPIDMARDRIDLLAFAGHKGLYGPTGTGGLVFSDGFDHGRIRPLTFGGTGSASEQVFQPSFLPDAFESGTLNVAGIAGLCAGIGYLDSLPGKIEAVRKKKRELAGRFISMAADDVRGILFPAGPVPAETGVVSFNIEGIEPSEVCWRLSEEYGIMCRAGLQCAPLAHRTIGTFPRGTVRFSFGIFNCADEIDVAVYALKEIADSTQVAMRCKNGRQGGNE